MSAMIAQTGLLIFRNNVVVAATSGMKLSADGRIAAVPHRSAACTICIVTASIILLTVLKAMLVIGMGDIAYDVGLSALREGNWADRFVATLMTLDGTTNAIVQLLR